MQKIYIIPGLGENCNLKRYISLKMKLEEKGFSVISINPDWYKPLKDQIIPIEKDAILFGFSFGSILAYLISEKHICKKIIFASISPIHLFSYKELYNDYLLHMDENSAKILTKEIKNIKINLNKLKSPWITVAGQDEELLVGEKKSDILIPNTKHFMSKKYIDVVTKLV